MVKLSEFKKSLACVAGIFASLSAVHVNAQDTAAEYFQARQHSNTIPQVLNSKERKYYSDLFQSIEREEWGRVEALLKKRKSGPLHAAAKAEYYLHANSPKVEAHQISNWMSSGRHLPQAEQLSRLGARRGLSAQYPIPQARGLVKQPYATKRIRPRSVKDGTMPSSTRSAILARIKDDDPAGAHSILSGADDQLSAEARAEWRQRVAWSYYIENNDHAALSLAQTVSEGSGAWVAEGDWVAGLAAWRLNQCETAISYFERAAAYAYNPELVAAARYWASRSHVRCRSPEKASEQLRGAALLDETLYGMLAREQLGQHLSGHHASAEFSKQDWQQIKNIDNVRTAVALAEIGKEGLADGVLRHQAKIGNAAHYNALSRLARELGVPSTQLWMAHNAPSGAVSEPALRYPAPRWQPVNGWKVDPALAYAHTLQESNFRAGVVSPAGARGLMQIMPAAARDHAGKLGVRGNARDLSKPEINLAFGQEHLNMLRNSGATQGKLPKIMAAYNAGLRPVGRWNNEIRDQGDALLYMESIPYWETRGYVAIVMRNYWMYERQAAAQSPSRKALAEGQWPAFPQISSRRFTARD